MSDEIGSNRFSMTRYDGLPCVLCKKEDLDRGIRVVDILVFSGLAKSKGEAKSLIKQGAIRIGPYAS